MLAEITIGLGALLSGIFGSKTSPREDEVRRIIDKLYEEMDWLKTAPFTKDELLNSILPEVQKTYRGAADVAAGRAASTVPETTGAPSGQAFMEHYLQTMAPIIARGEEQAAGAITDFTQLWANIDQATKTNVLGAYQLALGGTQGLPDQTSGQRFFTNFLQGLNIGTTAYGNISYADALVEKGNMMQNLPKYFMSGEQTDLQKAYNAIFKKGGG